MEEGKTILFISPVSWNYYPYRDQELPAMLAEKGINCIYLNPVKYEGSDSVQRFQSVNKREVPANLSVIDRSCQIGKSFILFLYENLLNIQAVRKYKPDAVISTDHLMAALVCLYCRFKGIKFVFDVTDNWELVDTSAAGKLYKWILKPQLARNAYYVTATSQVQFDFFNNKRKRNTLLLSNAIPNEVFRQLKDTGQTSNITKSVNFIGSLRNWYDFELLFDVFSQLPEIELNIYGKGELYNELVMKSAAYSNINILGSVDFSKTASILKNSLFGVLPLKLNELNNSTCPIKLFDYWGAGKAVISTPVAEVRRVGGDSVLYAATVQEFISQIRLLLSNPDLSSNLGKKGLEKVEQIHNYQYIADKFIEILNF